jgi:hypothetical protein
MNGVPYGSGAEVTEYWEEHQGPTEAQYLIVSQGLRDSEHLVNPAIRRRAVSNEASVSQWNPTPYALTPSP